MDAFIFNQRVKHGRLDFHPTVVYGFEDPDAAPYFSALGFGDASEDDPAVIISTEELDIDLETILASSNYGERRGQRVIEGAE